MNEVEKLRGYMFILGGILTTLTWKFSNVCIFSPFLIMRFYVRVFIYV